MERTGWEGERVYRLRTDSARAEGSSIVDEPGEC